MTVIPTPTTYTTGRFQMVLPEFNNRVDVRILNQAFERLDADAASLRVDNEFDANVRVHGDLAAWGSFSIAQDLQFGAPVDTVLRRSAPGILQVNTGGGGLQAGAVYLGTGPTANLTWGGAGAPDTMVAYNHLHVALDLTVRRNTQVDGALTVNQHVGAYGGIVYFRNDNAIALSWDGASLVSSHTLLVNGAAVYFEPSKQVGITWRSDLGALYFNYGNGIYAEGTSNFAAVHSRGGITAASTISTAGQVHCTHLNTTADVQAAAPVYVAGQNGDGFLRWYPKALFDSAGTPFLAHGSAASEVASDGLWRLSAIYVGGWETGDGRLRVPAGFGGFLYLTVVVTINDNTPPDAAPALRLLVNGGAVNTAGELTSMWARLPRQYIGQSLWGSWAGRWPAGTILELQFGQDVQMNYVRHEGGSCAIGGQPLTSLN